MQKIAKIQLGTNMAFDVIVKFGAFSEKLKQLILIL